MFQTAKSRRPTVAQVLQLAGFRRGPVTLFSPARLRRAPLRIVTGAFILNSAVGKLGGDEKTAAGLHGIACRAYPVLAKAEPQPFPSFSPPVSCRWPPRCCCRLSRPASPGSR
jgi:hypothetical protein